MATDTNNLDQFLGAKPRPWWRRWLKWIVIGIVVVAAGLLLSRCFGGAEKTEYATVAVERGNLTITVSATGKLEPTNQVEVGSELSGLVEQVLVDVNDRVTKGQPLAILDPSRLDDAIRQSEATLAANQASVAQARATLQEARAQLARMQEVNRLSNGRVPAKTEMDSAQAAVARAVANVRAAEANVVAARAALSSNQTQRYKSVIRSPVNGVVLARQIDAGQTVAASFNTPTLFVIAEDLSQMKLTVAIDEADVGEVTEGQKASFTVDAFPGRTFPASITRVDLGSNLSALSSSTSTTTTSNQVVSYGADLTVANPDLKLRPGMTATAEIVTTSRPNVLLIPNAALRFAPQEAQAAGGTQQSGGIAGAIIPRRRGGSQGETAGADANRGASKSVYVLGADGKPQAVSIVTGESNGTLTEVTGGALKPGMKVITGQLAAGSASRSSSGSASGARQGGQRGQ
ncbi:MAG: efflux RND transporter periplasmic adaptor subunit [Pseudomonadota bacterium]